MSPALTPAQISKTDRLVWIDCEMTGLDPNHHVLVEIAAIVTDANLIPLDEGIDIVIHATEEELSTMDSFVLNMHTTSGLLDEIRASTTTRAEAEEQILNYMKKHIPVAGAAPLAGNSIGTDRGFINVQMPRIDDFLHYRMIDVSTIKELVRRWQPRIYQGQPEKGLAHRALQDIKESIRELEFYRQLLFKPATTLSTHTIEESAVLASKKIPTTDSMNID